MKAKKALIIAILVLAVAAAAVLGFTMKPAEEAEHDAKKEHQMKIL